MTYQPKKFADQTKRLTEAYKWGVRAVTGLVTAGFITSEVARILALPLQLSNYLYLVLLGSCALLIALWIWSCQNELWLLSEWLDPKDYVPPDDTLLLVSFGIVLPLVLFSSRNPIWFGIVFSCYSAGILLATWRLASQLREALLGSRERLREDKANPELLARASLYESGLNVLETYFLTRSQRLRHIVITVLASAGLLFSVFGRLLNHPRLETAAYVIYISSVLGSELLILYWRTVRDRELRPLTAKLAEVERALVEAGRLAT